MLRSLVFVGGALAVASASFGQYTTIDFSSQFNMNRNESLLLNGGTFPTGNQVFNHNGDNVPVALGGVGSVNVPWAWSAYNAVTGGPASLTVPINMNGITSVFTTVSTFWGSTDADGLATITFNATNGVSHTVHLVGNQLVRDYNQNIFTNGLNNTTAREVFSNGAGQRVDMQRFDLPAAFAGETLVNIVFEDTGAANVQRIFVSGITVVPTPGAGALLIGAGLFAGRRRR